MKDDVHNEMCVMVEANLGDNPLNRLPNSVAGMFAIYETQAVLQRELERDERFAAYSHPEKLLLAYPAEPMRMGEIAETLGCLPSSITAIVDRLESAGLLRREADPDDRRAKRLLLTEKGLKVRATMMKASAEMFSAVTGLDETGTKQLLALLSRRAKFNAM
jgi:MarR family transcriptional regulator, organic hydroperoxide resistance regulator